ncbi:hypothetical protein PLEOSDRAFT_49472 [Pleurotus ostreatus PC15]|uniref:Uncharacterized protein n=1 Tax=Pleurotus ostreatus (strain PC15) TaxID=1137138 RepID=A0A067NS89_PLEO1|nr:hypothetical protein PLEOSDRAFT_49472 [Pleurotus ostreatus PC15]
MWRQVELTVQQGRYLGSARFLGDQGANGAVPPSTETNQEPEVIDMDVSCEIFLNDVICGRTTVKKGIGSPDWHESFTFPDLPPFEMLDVNVWREKKLFKPTMMGSVRITLSNFRRGEAVEGWFPVLHSGVAGNDVQVGEIRLKIRVDEEIILPATTYEGLLEALNSRNFLDWMIDFETKLHLKTITTQLMSIAVARNVLIPQVQELADREVDGTPSSHQTLFRGNTILTKVMEACMSWYGKAFLEASIGDVLRRLCDEKVAIEVDPVRSGKSTRDMDKNRELLIQWCERFWIQIHSVRNECPNEMRKLFEHVRKLVEGRYNLGDLSQEQNRDLPWQSLPSPAVKRSLTLVAKVMQSLANLNASVQKEEFMRGIKDFLADNRDDIHSYQ